MADAAAIAGKGSPLGNGRDEAATGAAVRQMFGEVARRYDFLNHLLSMGTDIAWRNATTRALTDVLTRPGSRVADVCCGTGDLSFSLSRKSQGVILGADFCHPMLSIAREKACQSKRVYFLEADTLHLPFEDSSLDAITSAFGFRNLANYVKGIEEMGRVLKPGGKLAILEFSRVRWPIFGPIFRFYFRHFLPRIGAWISGVEGPYSYLPDSVSKFPDQDALAEMMRKAGFRNVTYRNFTGGVAALHVAEKS
jgi:demethylmenaquinone methyltransferase/2-methoxy-6-polyprenyl-1,4-benzoquinol methylase